MYGIEKINIMHLFKSQIQRCIISCTVTRKNVLGAGDGEDGFYRLGLYMYLSIQSLASIIDLINSCEIKEKEYTIKRILFKSKK